MSAKTRILVQSLHLRRTEKREFWCSLCTYGELKNANFGAVSAPTASAKTRTFCSHSYTMDVTENVVSGVLRGQGGDLLLGGNNLCVSQTSTTNFYWFWLSQLLGHEKLEWLHGAIWSEATPRDLVVTTQTFFRNPSRPHRYCTNIFSQPLETSSLLHKHFFATPGDLIVTRIRYYVFSMLRTLCKIRIKTNRTI